MFASLVQYVPEIHHTLAIEQQRESGLRWESLSYRHHCPSSAELQASSLNQVTLVLYFIHPRYGTSLPCASSQNSVSA